MLHKIHYILVVRMLVLGIIPDPFILCPADFGYYKICFKFIYIISRIYEILKMKELKFCLLLERQKNYQNYVKCLFLSRFFFFLFWGGVGGILIISGRNTKTRNRPRSLDDWNLQTKRFCGRRKG